ncbi:MAG: 4-alpha-glucanotransferase [Actinomycetaceae bacterium]|nr:4-alpha-glucanotransferase [Actinomycetaceae bacterium]MDY6083384.1 4-alpha-glucanotransferase [Actinomycetaceae bacterium]
MEYVDDLHHLAEAHHISLDYWAFDGTLKNVSNATLTSILRAMGIDASTDEAIEAALQDARLKDWRATVAPTTVVRQGESTTVQVHVPHGSRVTVTLYVESGGERPCQQVDDWELPRTVDGTLVGQASFAIPADLPLGYHTIVVSVWPIQGSPFTESGMLITVPSVIPSPYDANHRGWGVMAQLYSVRSRQSWGVGDLADLGELGSIFADSGADFVLINPLFAAQVTGSMDPSPYLPVTRQFFNPLYIRPEDIPEVAYLSAPQRALITWASEDVKAASSTNTMIDRDAAWKAKKSALQIIFDAGRTYARQHEFARFRQRGGEALEDFALWCALHETYGDTLPEPLQDKESAEAKLARVKLSDRVDFYAWLQWIVDQQMEAAQHTATSAGMRLGICHDLAVGIASDGADDWANPGAYVHGVSVGAPPDMYNQQGQSWAQPPLNPETLPQLHFAPYIGALRNVFAHAGALRIDHVMGLFRLWWIPEGSGPADGAYVHYDHEAMVGILALEAVRAGAVVIGEDLGNVEPWVRNYLDERGIYGTSVLWFEQKDHGEFKEPHEYRQHVLAAVDTHDLPPAAGYLAGEHVDVRERLGLLTQPVAEVRAQAEAEREQMVTLLRRFNLVGDDPTERELVEAMHEFLALTTAELMVVSLTDMVGERRMQNQPGTSTEYPNWKIPLADSTEDIVMIEDLPTHPRYRSMVEHVTQALSRAAR